MFFGDKLKQLRLASGYSQEAVAKKLGVTNLTYQRFEDGCNYPMKIDIYVQLSSLFNLPIENLFSDDDNYLMEAHKKGGASAMKHLKRILDHLNLDVELPERDRIAFLSALTSAFWRSKEEARKRYTPKKYRHSLGINS